MRKWLLLAVICCFAMCAPWAAMADDAADNSGGVSIIDYYYANKNAVLQQISDLIEARNYVDAHKLISTYRAHVSSDKDLLRLEEKYRKLDRDARESGLLAEVKPIPGSNIEKNLELYQKLHDLVPENPEYMRKLEVYKAKRAESNRLKLRKYFANPGRTKHDYLQAVTLLDQALTSKPTDKEFARFYYALNRDALLFPEGNGHVEIALEQDGDTEAGWSYYVWVYNVQDSAIDVGCSNFQARFKDGSDAGGPISCPSGVIDPGHALEGQVVFPVHTTPSTFVFSHSEVGEVARQVSFQ